MYSVLDEIVTGRNVIGFTCSLDRDSLKVACSRAGGLSYVSCLIGRVVHSVRVPLIRETVADTADVAFQLVTFYPAGVAAGNDQDDWSLVSTTNHRWSFRPIDNLNS